MNVLYTIYFSNTLSTKRSNDFQKKKKTILFIA